MTPPGRRILVLGLGNDIRGDDGVGLIAAQMLRESSKLEGIDVREWPVLGFDLLEFLEGYECALLLDAVVTGKHPHGAVVEFSREDFEKVAAPSLHYAGIAEVFKVAEQLGIPMPKHFRILALEVEEIDEFKEGLSGRTKEALPAYVGRARMILDAWSTKPGCTNTR